MKQLEIDRDKGCLGGDADRAIQEGSGEPALQAGYCMCQTTLGG